MTITLAAVYAPVGIQGGLTGALFREFAFTLAGAVIVSGIVALTLSPMMGSKLLRAGDTERGFAGWINRRFDSVRRRLHARAGRHAALPAGRARRCGRIVALLIVPFYMFSQRELAPAEDQGVVFGIVQAAPNSTSTRRSCSPSRSTTSTTRSRRAQSIFQITFPTGGFGGMVTKPWSERTQDDAAAADGVDGAAVEDPRHPRHPADAAAAAGRRRLPGRLRDRLDGRAASSCASSPSSSCRRRSRAACSSSPTPT